jgi:hypothetical protein
MSVSLQNRRGVHGTHKKRGIHEHMIERRAVQVRRNAERGRTPGAELNKLFHMLSLPMEAASG